MKKLLIPAVVVLLSALTGCASVPMASPEMDNQAKAFKADPGMANIYVYRNESLGAALALSLELDGKHVGKTGAKTYMLFKVKPGKHTVMSRSESDSSVEVDAKAGQNYFVWQEIKMGMMSARTKLQLVDEQQGRAGVMECKLGQQTQ